MRRGKGCGKSSEWHVQQRRWPSEADRRRDHRDGCKWCRFDVAILGAGALASCIGPVTLANVGYYAGSLTSLLLSPTIDSEYSDTTLRCRDRSA
jgi:hypothetical protein